MAPAARRSVLTLTAALAATATTVVVPGTAGALAGPAPTPTFAVYPAAAGQADAAGEPSLGTSFTADTTQFESNAETYTVDFADAPPFNGATGTSAWSDKSYALAGTGLDPILFTDHTTGRTLVSQLLLACSNAYFTDDLRPASPAWTKSTGCGAGTLLDHQTIGGGTYPAGSPFAAVAKAAGYVDGRGAPHAVYYCAQYEASANCARSDNGGLSFGAGVPIYNTPANSGTAGPTSCAGLHGHLKVAPDGTAYVPNFDCDGHVAVTVSTDAGTTWNVHEVPTSTTQDESDPSIGIGSGGTVYLGWEEGSSDAVGSKAYVGVSHDRGATWSGITDVGAAFGVQNVQFPEVVAGDDGRAAVAFLGSTTPGSDQAGGATKATPASQVFAGVWHLYIATTYDGGATWKTVDATPDAPVQRGCIWLGGGSSSCRNLLDFNDMTIDRTGRILVGYADGCVGVCKTTPLPADQAYDATATKASYRANHGTIARQTSGLTLFAAFDGALPAAGAATPPTSVPEAPIAVGVPVVAALLLLARRRALRG